MDRALKVWDLRTAKRSLSIDTKGYSEMNYVSLSEGNRSAVGTNKVPKLQFIDIVIYRPQNSQRTWELESQRLLILTV